jgi:hypothetical protein
MQLKAEDFNDQGRFRMLLTLPYGDIVSFVFDYLRRKTGMTLFYWAFCIISLGLCATIRINISKYFELREIFMHTLVGAAGLPLLIIPAHELLHIIPYFLSGARKIRIGMDLRQYIFFVTAHRHVATPLQFKVVAFFPFLVITILLLFLIFYLPGLWKWSLSLFLFIHTTMCAGDFAMLNFYHINRKRKIYTWDDADAREAYFYEEI